MIFGRLLMYCQVKAITEFFVDLRAFVNFLVHLIYLGKKSVTLIAVDKFSHVLYML